MERGKIWRHFDFLMLFAVALLIIIGIAMIRSTTLTSADPELQSLTGKQILFTAVGIVILFIASAVDYRFWGATAGTLYTIFIILLLIVDAIGITSFGANRWIQIGTFNLQPSEVGKFLMVLTLGHYVATHLDEVQKLPFVVRTLIHVGVPMALIFFQPDLSTAVMYGVIWFAILWAAGLPWQHIALFAGILAVLVPLGFLIAVETPLLRYMADRLVVFLFPNPESQAYRDAAYNINQALISIGSGGWFGQGYGHGTQVQLRFLKVRHSDFIFSSISNELGFVGAVAVIVLITFVVYRIFRAGRMARDAYGSFICYGAGAVLLYQAFFNIGMNMQLLPVSGITLPFVSYGGSSLWAVLFGIGLVQSVILRHKQIDF